MNFSSANKGNDFLMSHNIFKKIVHKFFLLRKTNPNLVLDDLLDYLIKDKWFLRKLDYKQMLNEIDDTTFNDIYNYVFEQAKTNPFIDLNNLGDLI